jgi:light-harvesting protein B-800-850 alpha chain
MNQGKMWLVVKPSFGIPFFLSVVAIVSLIVHFSILTHTTWFPGFLQGGKKTAVVATP